MLRKITSFAFELVTSRYPKLQWLSPLFKSISEAFLVYIAVLFFLLF